MEHRLNISIDALTGFCQKWDIDKLGVFGSVLREDFKPESDLDFLVAFSQDADWGMLDHVAMQQELEQLSGRKVDLVTEKALNRSNNWIRQREIRETVNQIYPAQETVHVP
ncbi:MAG: hypothetical protein HOE48_08460 [Candidatus Latescibacteria bacterium]|jgi:uncharacterized protein|nr:hypothetical protein [Candidatus Latescibacterota bacterium]MBT4137932.1 hypothetical protein [Candidatus Latescibacterota bacterium]MBT5831214.1 hypothetical protein [Candidatus Latescibacterota bacterium]